MKFSRIKILEACDYIIEQHEVKESRRDQAYELFLQEHQAAWMKRELPKWRLYRDAITKALRTGKPIDDKTIEHHPTVYRIPQSGKRDFEYKGERFASGTFRDYEFVCKVKRILSAAMDDGITVTELRQLEISQRDVVYIIERHAQFLKEQEARVKRAEFLAKKEAEAAKDYGDGSLEKIFGTPLPSEKAVEKEMEGGE